MSSSATLASLSLLALILDSFAAWNGERKDVRSQQKLMIEDEGGRRG